MTIDSLDEFFNAIPNVKSQFSLILVALKRRQLHGSHSYAKATMEILRNILGNARFNNAEDMIKIVKSVGQELVAAAPSEYTIGNLVKRVLFLIREEYVQKIRLSEKISSSSNSTSNYSPSISSSNTTNATASVATNPANRVKSLSIDKRPSASSTPSTKESLDNTNSSLDINNYIDKLLSSASDSQYAGSILTNFDKNNNDIDYSRHFPDMRQSVMGSLHELNDELDSVFGPISELAQEHIHADECIMVFGHSQVVELFLKAAARKRRFQVVISESAPSLDGHRLANSLSKVPNISITLIPDSGIYALMSRINKVIFSPQAVMADGGAIASCGHAMLTLAAKDFSVPVLGITGTYLLTPLFAHTQVETLSQLLSPVESISYNTPGLTDQAEFNIPVYDYIPPEQIDLYVTNNGCHLPSYIFRLLPEYYHISDYNL